MGKSDIPALAESYRKNDTDTRAFELESYASTVLTFELRMVVALVLNLVIHVHKLYTLYLDQKCVLSLSQKASSDNNKL